MINLELSLQQVFDINLFQHPTQKDLDFRQTPQNCSPYSLGSGTKSFTDQRCRRGISTDLRKIATLPEGSMYIGLVRFPLLFTGYFLPRYISYQRFSTDPLKHFAVNFKRSLESPDKKDCY
jgi:hypothetical protein